MRIRYLAAAALAAAIAVLAGCANPNPAPNPPPTPPAAIVTIGVTPASIVQGQSATLTWSSTNATACTASGAWSGAQSTTGTAAETPGAPGSVVYTLTCTGAGASGTASATLAVTAPAAPTVSLAFDNSTIAPGGNALLTWSSTNATACSAMGTWSGPQPTSGSLVVTQPVGGYGYSLACSGPGGSASASTFLLATNVKPSSYENKNEVGYAPAALPPPGGNAWAEADFFQDGTPALVLATLVYNVNDPSTYGNHGQFYFYRQISGVWVDSTAQLLSDTTGCLQPRKAIVADFNRDGRPDVFFACHGIDVAPYSGESPHLLLSQPDGTYKNVTLPVTCYCHGASAADINGDGYPDILVTDTTVARTPFFLMNQGDGTFTPDFTRLPTTLLDQPIFSAELIDFSGNGHYDVFLAGDEPGIVAGDGFPPQILPNDGTGKFISTTPVNLLTPSNAFGLALDIAYVNGSIYLLQVNPAYNANQILKIAYPALTQSVVFNHSGNYINGNPWVDWILPYQGSIVSANANFGLSIPQ